MTAAAQAASVLEIEGVVSSVLPLREFFTIIQAGEPMPLDDLEFEFTLRTLNTDTSPAFKASTLEGTMQRVIVVNDDSNDIPCLRFNNCSLAGLLGDYIADFVMIDPQDGNAATHLGSGIVTVTNSPVAPN